MRDPEPIWRGWPSNMALALYGQQGHYVFETKKPDQFDIADEAARLAFEVLPAEFHLGMKHLKEPTMWSEEAITVCEDNILYEFQNEGYDVELTRVKAPSVVSLDEVIWRINLK